MPRTKTYDRQEVLEKALLLFHLKGYEATGVSDLVEHMGISRSSIYDSFGDKDGLYKEALELYQSQTSQKLIQVLQQTDDVITTLKDLLLGGFRKNCEEGVKGCLMANTCTESNLLQQKDINQLIIQNHREFVNALSSAIDRSQQLGRANPSLQARQYAELLFLTNNGASIVSKVTDDLQPTFKALELAINLLEPAWDDG